MNGADITIVGCISNIVPGGYRMGQLEPVCIRILDAMEGVDENTRCCPDFDTELIAQIEKAIGKVEFVVSSPLRKLDASGEKKRDWMY